MESSRTLCIYIGHLTLEEKKELVNKAAEESYNFGLIYKISNECTYLHYHHPTSPEKAEAFHKQAIQYVDAIEIERGIQ